MSTFIAAITIVLPTYLCAQSPPTGFETLFNGQNLEGWHGMPHVDPDTKYADEEQRKSQFEQWMNAALQHWRVEEGELVNDGDGPYLTTDREFGDIELLIDYKTVPLADSGIYLRATPQVQIWDYTEAGGKWDIGAEKGSGGLFNNAAKMSGRDPLVLADKPFGEWNSFRILQVGARTSIWLNDQLVVDHAILENFWDHSRPLRRMGPIQLQTHGGEIRWRNIFLREIGSEEANQLLARDDEGFASIFNGQDFEGWAGDLESYEVRDGAIACKPGKGGNVFTQEEYEDFIVRLEFQLPSGGNNGLAIRYPGTGQPHLTAMCELQVLDNEAPQYASLDPRQYHGSAYGMAPAHRGYLRPTGEWNYQEVTVQGSKVKVELNGFVILDTDLSQITEYKDGAAPPGKERTRGHFGFAGHIDPVAFRNISIKRLPASNE